MLALSLGFGAALAWGIHDLLVRQVSVRVGPYRSLLYVLFFGAVAQGFILLLIGERVWETDGDLAWSAVAGVTFLLACVGLYRALEIGPVRLVAPVIGAYPVLSFALAAATGAPFGILQWACVAVLGFGIALVARGEDGQSETGEGIFKPIAFSVLAMVGFASTFTIGQQMGGSGHALGASLVTRLVALAILAIVAFVLVRNRENPARLLQGMPLVPLAFMGMLDAVAIWIVFYAGGFENAAYATASASLFGLVTILLAWGILKERLNPMQWMGVLVAFGGIAVLALTAG